MPLRAVVVAILVLFAFSCEGVSHDNIDKWRETEKGPGKLKKALASSEHDADMRAHAAQNLIQMREWVEVKQRLLAMSDSDRAAVIDKDRVSMLLAVRLGSPRFVITTSVDHVYENFYSDEPIAHSDMTTDQVRAMHADRQFAPGSMAPKMEAAVDYLDAVDGEMIICLPEALVEAIDGDAGTHIRRNP